jgi:2-keto-4-pentenoate hydratase
VRPEIADQIASCFVTARKAGRAIDAFPGTIPETLDDAYQVQDAAISRFDEAITGWKVGRILPPLAERYGADRLAGPIFESVVQSADNATGMIFAGGFGAAEAEFLLRIGTAPPQGKSSFTLDEAADLIDTAHVGFEIASSPLASVNHDGAPVIISDFGNNNGLIIGPEIPDWRSSQFEDWIVATMIDDVEVGRGSASAFPDGPIGSVRFLLELMARRGIALPAGTWVSTGAVSGVHEVKVGQRVESRFGNHHVMRCTIAATPTR